VIDCSEFMGSCSLGFGREFECRLREQATCPTIYPDSFATATPW
jgi:hypothetical protein